MSKQVIAYDGEHLLSYAEYGRKEGRPILVQHGLIASIEESHLFSRLIKAGMRVICPARPGYGTSSPRVMDNIAGWADIVSSLIEALDMAHFDVLGISSGAPYSYALGYKFPHKVQTVYILSGTPALYDKHVQANWPYPLDPHADMAARQKLAHELFFAHVAPADRAAPAVRDAMMNGGFGVAQDLHLRGRDWGFDLSEMTAPVYMRHSKRDEAVPLAAAEITAKLLPNCRLEVTETDVHFSDEVLDDFIKTSILARGEREKRPFPSPTQ